MDLDERPGAHSADLVIETRDLGRCYGDPASGGFEAVSGVNLRVRRGELFTLLGTNGAGKTSALELLEGLAQPTSGQVRVLGLDPYAARARVRPRIGVMLQAGGFAGELTVQETVRMWAGCTKGARPVHEAIGAVGLEPRRGVRVSRLSGGERRRLDLGLALLGRPEVLFLDEPTTGMDPQSRHSTWEIVRSLQRAGTTVVMCTHYLEEAQALSDRVAIVHEGRVVSEGTTADVVSAQPATISFEPPDPETARPWPEIPGARWSAPGAPRVVVQTDDLQRTLTDLLVWAREREVALARLEARPASLEEAFLAIAAGAQERRGAAR